MEVEAFIEEVPINEEDYDFLTTYTSLEAEKEGTPAVKKVQIVDTFIPNEDPFFIEYSVRVIMIFSTVAIIFIVLMVVTLSTRKMLKTRPKKTATLEF